MIDDYGTYGRERMKKIMEQSAGQRQRLLNRRKMDRFDKTLCWASVVMGTLAIVCLLTSLGVHLYWHITRVP